MNYRINEHGLYELCENDKIIDTMSEVAILYDSDLLLRHGRPELVKTRFDTMLKLYKDRFPDYPEMWQGLGYIQGKFPIDELNKILDVTSYIDTFIKRFKESANVTSS